VLSGAARTVFRRLRNDNGQFPIVFPDHEPTLPDVMQRERANCCGGKADACCAAKIEALEKTLRIIVVGGSLSGLSAAIALARLGHEVAVTERATSFTGGAGLGVDVSLLRAVTGDPGSPAVIRGNRLSSSWYIVRAWLLEIASRTAGLTLREGVEATSLQQTDTAVIVTTNQSTEEAALVIGADGYRSMVRAFINPANPEATYAGYMLWRGMCREDQMPANTRWPDGFVTVQFAKRYRLVAYAVPGPDDSLVPGRRQISWAWYDPDQRELLERHHCLAGDRVIGTLSGDRFGEELRGHLVDEAMQSWPSPWREAIVATLHDGDPFATPIAEYVPDRLVANRLAIIGDAAHVASPMTGSGFRYGLLDVLALARSLSKDEDVPQALRRFENERLSDDRELVLSGLAWGKQYLKGEA
jgi:2-polyprenyl-6-methoxyphenol hydroxylase-like FAD-dependent oxidoreductase